MLPDRPFQNWDCLCRLLQVPIHLAQEEETLDVLHRIALAQLVPDCELLFDARDSIF
jgi:hypothetical protein